MQTNIQIETGLMRWDPPPNQRDKKLKQDWRGVKFRLAATRFGLYYQVMGALLANRPR